MISLPDGRLPVPVVPKELGGKWIAWTHDGSRIVAFGDTLDDCEAAVEKAGEAKVRYEKTPSASVRLLGASR